MRFDGQIRQFQPIINIGPVLPWPESAEVITEIERLESLSSAVDTTAPVLVRAIQDFEQHILQLANKLCGQTFTDPAVAVESAITQIDKALAIPNPEHYGISADLIKLLRELRIETLETFAQYIDPDGHMHQHAYMGLGALVSQNLQIEETCDLLNAIDINASVNRYELKQQEIQRFIASPKPISETNPEIIIDATAGMQGLGSLVSSSRIRPNIVSPSGIRMIGEVIGEHAYEGTLFITGTRRATDLRGGSTSFTDGLEEVEIRHQHDNLLRSITQWNNSCIYVKIPIDLDKLEKDAPLVLPTPLGKTVNEINAEYARAMKDSLGLTYIFGLDVNSLPRDDEGKPYISYTLVSYKTDTKLFQEELPQGSKFLDQYPTLKRLLDLAPQDVVRMNLIRAFIAQTSAYIDDPDLTSALCAAPNMLQMQAELGFYGTCADFAYCAELMFREAKIPAIQVNGWVLAQKGLTKGFEANATHAVNLVKVDDHISVIDITKTTSLAKLPKDSLKNYAADIKAAASIADGNEATFKQICRETAYIDNMQAWIKPYINREGIHEMTFDQLPERWKNLIEFIKQIDDPSISWSNSRLVFLPESLKRSSPCLAHAVTDLLREHSPLERLLRATDKVAMIFDSKLQANGLISFWDLTPAKARIIAPAFKQMTEDESNDYLLLMYERDLNKKIYTQKELDSLLIQVKNTIDIMNQETGCNFRVDLYHLPALERITQPVLMINAHSLGVTGLEVPARKWFESHQTENLILFSADGKLDPLSAPNVFFDPCEVALKAAPLANILSPEDLAQIKAKVLARDLRNTDLILVDHVYRPIVFAALDLTESRHALAEAFRILGGLPAVQNDPYYQGAKAIFAEHSDIHERYYQAFQKNSTTGAKLIINAIAQIYGETQAACWARAAWYLGESSEPYISDDRKAELLKRLPPNTSTTGVKFFTDAVTKLHEDLVLLLTEYHSSKHFINMAAYLNVWSEEDSSCFLRMTEEAKHLDLNYSLTYKALDLGPAADRFPVIRELIANLSQAPYLKLAGSVTNDSHESKSGITPDGYSVEVRDYVPGDPINRIAHRISARIGKPMVKSGSPSLIDITNLHHYVIDLRLLEDPQAMQSLLKEIDEKLAGCDHRNVRSSSKIELKFTLALDGIRITELNHQALLNAFKRSTSLHPEYGLRTNLEGFMGELRLLEETRPKLIPDQFIRGIALDGTSERMFIIENQAKLRSKNYSCFVVSNDESFVRSFESTVRTVSSAKPLWLRTG